MIVNIYQTHGGKNKRISQAFHQGTGFPIVPPAPLRPGALFMYGAMRGLMPTLRQAQAEGRTWFYADNAYFRRSQDRVHKVDGYFRITRNAIQHDGTGDFGPERWEALNMPKIAPWRKTGTHVLVCPLEALFASIWGLDPVKWLEDTMAALKRATDRPLVIRPRALRTDASKPLSAALKDAWALVTHSSNAAVDALLAGVPTFCTDRCAAYRMGEPDLSKIEAPVMPDDREQWAWALAANQWSITEMRSGLCWRELQTR